MCSLSGCVVCGFGARLRLVLLLLALGGLLLAAGLLLSPAPASADDWDGDQVIREEHSRDGDAEDAEREPTADERRQAYDDAADPEAARQRAKARGKGKGKRSSKDDPDAEDEPGGVDRYGSYFGLGDEERGAPADGPEGGELRYVEGQGYVRDSGAGHRHNDDGTTEVLREREGRDSADADAAEAEQVWGPLWGVPADSPVMQNYDGPGRPMSAEEEAALRTGNRAGHAHAGAESADGDSTEVVYGDEEELSPRERKLLARQRKAEERARAREQADETDAVGSDEDEDGEERPEPKINRSDPDEW